MVKSDSTNSSASDNHSQEAILVVSPWGLRGQYSGPVMLMNRLFEALGRNGRFQIDVAFRDRGHEESTCWTRRVFPLSMTSAGRFSRVDQLRWALRARRFLKRSATRYRYVHLQGAYLTNILAVPRAVRKKLILLPVLENGDLPNTRGRTRAKAFLYRKVVRDAFLALALSAGIEDALVSLGLSRGRVLRINNPAGAAGAAADGLVGTPRLDATYTVGFVGKIGPNKNPHLVLEAVAGLRSEGLAVRALFVGPFVNEQFEQHFRALEERLGLSAHTTVTGFVSDVQSHLGQMDVFVLPSKHEGMPGALAEALTFGLPAVVTDVGEMARHVEAGRAGFVVEAQASSIIEALRKLSDSSLRRTVGESGRMYGEANFLAEGVAAAILEKIDELEGEGAHDGT